MTNASELHEMLKKMRQYEEDWSARRIGEEYGERMSGKIFDGLIAQMKLDGRIREGEIGAVIPMEEDTLRWSWNENEC